MTTREFLDRPFTMWSALYPSLATEDAAKIEAEAAALATAAARLSAYLSRRMGGGLHEDAVKRQNQAARKVRQALGYTYADDAITF